LELTGRGAKPPSPFIVSSGKDGVTGSIEEALVDVLANKSAIGEVPTALVGVPKGLVGIGVTCLLVSIMDYKHVRITYRLPHLRSWS
tara:strand:- start:6551 stop:6811 length:261 start_codon:yes stop_codon:yes gene_type:complete